jgi:hypothetical protein
MSGVDHRPYLVEGDLRTPEDVLAWLCEYDPREQLGDALVELRVQLRRERRQACRRGALEHWRAAAICAGRPRARHRSLATAPFIAFEVSGPWEADDGFAVQHLTAALAFRAAARQP